MIEKKKDFNIDSGHLQKYETIQIYRTTVRPIRLI